MAKRLILCDCSGSQELDADALSSACGIECSRIHTALCTTELDSAAKALQEGEVIIACQQERLRFEELAAELDAEEPEFLDLRDRAGWSDDESPKTAKMAALVAESRLPVAEIKTIDVLSEGICLILGEPDVALQAARDLCSYLSVTVLLPPASQSDLQYEMDRRFDVVFGKLAGTRGSLGRFDVEIDTFSEIVPGGRGEPAFTEPRDGARSACDLILDLTGDDPLFGAPDKRDGYLRADPRSAEQVAKAIFDASHLTGTFEKPLYVRLEADLCAHSRASKTGCSKCIDNCPTGAISPDGDYVAVDAAICAGCGTCSAICPSGAISYDAPPPATLFKRIETLAATYRKAAGSAPRLLVHDGEFGVELISLCARYDRGLPSDVIPLEVPALAGFGHAEMLAALGCGFAAVSIVPSPTTERAAIEREAEIALAISPEGTISLLDISEPSQLSDALFADFEAVPVMKAAALLGTRRQVARLAAKALQPAAVALPLPDHAPYGTVILDTDACTLCLACVSLCPSGALGDNPDAPQLRFQESACLQCGLCKNVCPEAAISLEPRLNLADDALSHVVLHQEEPFDCIECGKPFGVKSTIMRITEKLAGKHSMFSDADAVRLIQMCDDCRVNAQFHSADNPFAGGEPPKVRTTDDYLSKRRDH